LLRWLIFRSFLNGLSIWPDGLSDSSGPTPVPAVRFSGACFRSFLLWLSGCFFAPASCCSCLSTEYLLLCLVLISSRQRYPGSNGRGLQQLRYLCTALNAVPAIKPIQHLSGW